MKYWPKTIVYSTTTRIRRNTQSVLMIEISPKTIVYSTRIKVRPKRTMYRSRMKITLKSLCTRMQIRQNPECIVLGLKLGRKLENGNYCL